MKTILELGILPLTGIIILLIILYVYLLRRIFRVEEFRDKIDNIETEIMRIRRSVDKTDYNKNLDE